MPLHAFMLSDLAGTATAALLFPLILLAPGYLLGWALDLLDFRRRSIVARGALSLPFSVGVSPITAYLLELFCPIAAAPFFIACGITFVLLIWSERRGAFSSQQCKTALQRGWPLIVLTVGWMTLSVLLLVDLQIGNKLYFPTVTHDYAIRAAITASITRTGVPPRSPFFYADGFYTLRYHYFWYVLCSIAQRLGGTLVTPRQATLAGTAWCGAALPALVVLCTRFLSTSDRAPSDRRLVIAVGLLAVTGLDIVPVLLFERAVGGFYPSLEWWNEPVTSWAASALWAPHHVAGFIACMAGLLLLLFNRRRAAGAVVAGAMFASALGLSVHVTIAFAACIASWVLVSILRNQWNVPGWLAVSGASALVLSRPFLGELLAKQAGASGSGNPGGGGGGSFPLQPTIRPMKLFDFIMGFTGAGGWRENLAHLLILPINYSLELGFFLFAGVIYCRRIAKSGRALSSPEICTVTMVVTSILLCTFVRSSVIAVNDLGIRGFLFAQLVLLLFGADLLDEWWPRLWPRANEFARLAMALSLILGLAGTVYELFKVRFYTLLIDTTSSAVAGNWVSGDRHMGERTYAMREIYEHLKAVTPPNAIFQHNPDGEPQDSFYGMYADRQVAAETLGCNVVFGGDLALCPDRIIGINRIFSDPAAPVDDICSKLSVSVVVVRDTDKVWTERTGWVWTRKPLVANSYGRAFACGGSRALEASAR